MRRRAEARKLVLIAAVALLARPALGQEVASEAPGVLEVARGVVERAGYCALVSQGPDGRAESRIVDPFPPGADWTVWIATKPVTRKVEQIRKDPRVTLFYWDAGSLAYVTLLGDATLVDDPAEKAKRWKPAWKAFYEDENRGDDYLLIRVVPRRLEVISLAEGMAGDPETWRPPQHVFGATRPVEP